MMPMTNARPAKCPKCDADMRPHIAKTAIWIEERLFVVEDIPSQFCDSCMDQYYDDDVTDAIRRLTEQEFPSSEANREILVPVFSLEGRVAQRRPATEEELMADY